MTIEKLEYVVEMVNECKDSHNPVDTVWEYTNAGNKKQMYAIFTTVCYCDIFESPYVLNPKLIYRMGEFINDYSYLNG